MNTSVAANVTASMELSAGMKAHGMLMLLGWGVLMLPGAAAARYRFVFPQLGMSDTAWWKVHGIGQSVGALVVLAALATAIATKFTMHGGHPKVGALAIVAMLVQIALGIARPDKDSESRATWFTAHRVFGVIGVLAATLAMGLGLHLTLGHGGALFGLLLVLQVAGMAALGEFMRSKVPAPEESNTQMDEKDAEKDADFANFEGGEGSTGLAKVFGVLVLLFACYCVAMVVTVAMSATAHHADPHGH